jgi:cytochrome c oxidase assembly protein subunit 15
MQELTPSQRWQRRVLVLALIFVTCVVVLGAFTRLKDSGLGCPDWPGCYGHLDVFRAIQHVKQVNEVDPGSLPSAMKTVPEMVHRYFASTLGLLILVLAGLAWRNRKKEGQPLLLPSILVALVIFQGLLGMWTVTLGLQPIVVTLHLLGGFSTFTLLVLYAAQLFRWPQFSAPPKLRGIAPLGSLALLILIGQIFLGGWTASNYAAVACTDLPICQAGWEQKLDFSQAFTLWQTTDRANFEYGVLDNAARTTIHVMHRFGAIAVFIIVVLLCLDILRRSRMTFYRGFSGIIALLLLGQITLGVSNILFHVPLPVAVAHNFGALLLLNALVLFLYSVFNHRPPCEENK